MKSMSSYGLFPKIGDSVTNASQIYEKLQSTTFGCPQSLGRRSLETLNSARTPRPLSTVMNEETAYILAGSWDTQP